VMHGGLTQQCRWLRANCKGNTDVPDREHAHIDVFMCYTSTSAGKLKCIVAYICHNVNRLGILNRELDAIDEMDCLTGLVCEQELFTVRQHTVLHNHTVPHY
jgi:hypothetical protein